MKTMYNHVDHSGSDNACANWDNNGIHNTIPEQRDCRQCNSGSYIACDGHSYQIIKVI